LVGWLVGIQQLEPTIDFLRRHSTNLRVQKITKFGVSRSIATGQQSAASVLDGSQLQNRVKARCSSPRSLPSQRTLFRNTIGVVVTANKHSSWDFCTVENEDPRHPQQARGFYCWRKFSYGLRGKTPAPGATFLVEHLPTSNISDLSSDVCTNRISSHKSKSKLKGVDSETIALMGATKN
jgi:hypothetical protein